MKLSSRLLSAGAVLLVSSSALASDPDGLLTLIVGIPLLLGASVVLGVLLAFRPGNRRRAAAIVLFLPTCLYSLYVALDARTLLKDVGSENSLIGLAFFGLFALACLLFYLLVRRPTEGGT